MVQKMNASQKPWKKLKSVVIQDIYYPLAVIYHIMYQKKTSSLLEKHYTTNTHKKW